MASLGVLWVVTATAALTMMTVMVIGLVRRPPSGLKVIGTGRKRRPVVGPPPPVTLPRMLQYWEHYLRQERAHPLRELYGRERGQVAYIVGSGCSLQDYPADFWRQEHVVIIGINQVYQHIPCDYVIQKDSARRREALQYCQDHPATFVYSQCNYGNYDNGLSRREFGWPRAAAYVFQHLNNPNEKPLDTSPILERRRDFLAVSYSTLTSAVHLAAVLGIRTAILCGCDMGILGGQTNVAGYVVPPHHDTVEYQRWIRLTCLTQQLRDCVTACETTYGMVTLWAHPYPSLLDLVAQSEDYEIVPKEVL